MTRQPRSPLRLVEGGRDALKTRMFERLIFGGEGAWEAIAERLVRRGDLHLLPRKSPDPANDSTAGATATAAATCKEDSDDSPHG